MQIKIIAAIVGIFILSAGIYAIYGTSGNQQGNTVSANLSGDARCQLNEEKIAAIDASAVGDVAGFRGIEEPLDMTFFSFQDGDGNTKTLADWKGKTVLFNLWATWCKPCREEMPLFQELQVQRGGESFEVVPLSVDQGSDEKPKDFYKEIGLDQLPFLHDGTVKSLFDLKKKGVAPGMPTTILVDKNGCGLGVLPGAAHWSSPDALHLIDTALRLEKSS